MIDLWVTGTILTTNKSGGSFLGIVKISLVKLFTLAQPRRLVAMANALLGMVNIDLLLLLPEITVFVLTLFVCTT
jgi:hypothetical protein